MQAEQMREAFERMYRNDPVKLARGKYLRQDYDRRDTQANWEVFRQAWPIIFAAGMERAAKIMNPYDDEDTLGAMNAAAIRAEIKEKG